MSKFSKALKRLRKERGLSQSQLADALNISRTSIGNYEQGIREPSFEMAELIADYFNVDISTFFNDTQPKNIIPIETRSIPMIGDVACGEPITANQEFQSYVEVGANINCDCCLRARGDSMKNIRIYDGDIVFIKRQPMVENGDVAAIIIEDEVTLKRFYYYQENNLIILKPENSEYKDLIYSGSDLEQIKVFGKAVAFQSDIK